MDPLSVTASIIAVLGAVGNVLRGLEKINEIRNAPKEIKAIADDVEDIRGVLREIDSLYQNRQDIGSGLTSKVSTEEAVLDPRNDDFLPSSQVMSRRQSLILPVLGRAKAKLQALDDIVHNKLVSDGSPDKEPKFSRTNWIKHKQQVKALVNELREMRLNLLASMNIDISSDISDANFYLGRLLLNTTTLSVQYGQMIAAVAGQQRLLESENALPAHVESRFEITPMSNSPDLEVLQIPNSVVSPLDQSDKYPAPPMSELLYFGSFCPISCKCVCHIPEQMSTPRAVSNLFGQLYIGWTRDSMQRKGCPLSTCRYGASYAFRLTYRFPQWLFSRVVQIALASQARPEMLIRIPRIIPEEERPKDAVFSLAQEGDIAELMVMFQSRKVSPYDVEQYFGWSPLHFAALNGHVRCCQFLMSLESDPHYESYDQQNVFDVVQDQILCDLLSTSIRNEMRRLFHAPERLRLRNFTSMHHAVLKMTPSSIATVFEDSPSLLNVTDSQNRTPLYWAARRADWKSVKVLLELGADPNVGEPPLLETVSQFRGQPDMECIQLLLNAGADPNAVEVMGGYTILYLVCREFDQHDLLKLLQRFGAHIDSKSTLGWTPLYEAVRSCHWKIALYLISLGADPNPITCDKPLLFMAIHQVYPEAIEVAQALIKSGADCQALVKTDIYTENIAALQYATYWENTAIVKVLVDSGCVCQTGSFSCSPLRQACLDKKLDLVCLFMDRGPENFSGDLFNDDLHDFPYRVLLDFVIQRVDSTVLDIILRYPFPWNLAWEDEVNIPFYHHLASAGLADDFRAFEKGAVLRGSDARLHNLKGDTPLDLLARRKDYSEELEAAFQELIDAVDTANVDPSSLRQTLEEETGDVLSDDDESFEDALEELGEDIS